jgi:Vacuolar protein sorting 55
MKHTNYDIGWIVLLAICAGLSFIGLVTPCVLYRNASVLYILIPDLLIWIPLLLAKMTIQQNEGDNPEFNSNVNCAATYIAGFLTFAGFTIPTLIFHTGEINTLSMIFGMIASALLSIPQFIFVYIFCDTDSSNYWY